MAENATRGRIGRGLTALGIAWIIWSFISGSGLIDLEFANRFVNVPLLPGIVLVFLGRVLGRNARRVESQDDSAPQETPSPSSAPTPLPRPKPRVAVIESTPEPEARVLSEAVSGMEEEIADAVDLSGTRKTSAEMVEEARRRFGSRP